MPHCGTGSGSLLSDITLCGPVSTHAIHIVKQHLLPIFDMRVGTQTPRCVAGDVIAASERRRGHQAFQS